LCVFFSSGLTGRRFFCGCHNAEFFANVLNTLMRSLLQCFLETGTILAQRICVVKRRSGRPGSIENIHAQCENAQMKNQMKRM